jgi:hypothetical protein
LHQISFCATVIMEIRKVASIARGNSGRDNMVANLQKLVSILLGLILALEGFSVPGAAHVPGALEPAQAGEAGMPEGLMKAVMAASAFLEQKVTASEAAVEDYFGWSVALSGNTALVGVISDDSAYVFTRSGTEWSLQQKLTPPDGENGDDFGFSVALAGDTALVGAAHDDFVTTSDQGSAYVFTRSGTAWNLQQKLTATDGAPNSWFGWSVSLSGDTALLGAPRDEIGANDEQGSAYVFTRSGTSWSEQQKLTAPDGAAGDWFGYSVALSGDTALVGVPDDVISANFIPGSAYLFTRSGTTWSMQQKLTASDATTGDAFGHSVALAGDTALVGAVYDNIGANPDQGSAYIFSRSGTAWSEQQKLTASDGAMGDQFGFSVALDGDTMLVGAAGDGIGANIYQGSAYVFTRRGTAWSQQQKLTASDGAAWDNFGNSVALNGDTALVGAVCDDVGVTDQGSAYFYKLVQVVYLPLAMQVAP